MKIRVYASLKGNMVCKLLYTLLYTLVYIVVFDEVK